MMFLMAHLRTQAEKETPGMRAMKEILPDAFGIVLAQEDIDAISVANMDVKE